MDEFDQLYKEWAADRFDIPVENIQRVDFTVNSGTCGYGTCHYESFDINVWLEKAPKKGKYANRTYINEESEATTVINSILRFSDEQNSRAVQG